jgi:hypothetical protein
VALRVQAFHLRFAPRALETLQPSQLVISSLAVIAALTID